MALRLIRMFQPFLRFWATFNAILIAFMFWVGVSTLLEILGQL